MRGPGRVGAGCRGNPNEDRRSTKREVGRLDEDAGEVDASVAEHAGGVDPQDPDTEVHEASDPHVDDEIDLPPSYLWPLLAGEKGPHDAHGVRGLLGPCDSVSPSHVPTGTPVPSPAHEWRATASGRARSRTSAETSRSRSAEEARGARFKTLRASW